MGDAAGVADGPTLVRELAGDATTAGTGVAVEVEGLGLTVDVLGCELRPWELAVREGALILARSASDSRLNVATNSCAPF